MFNARIIGSLDGARIISRELRDIDDRFDDASPAWPEVTRIARALMQQAIETEGRSTDFGPWKPLAPSTIEQRRKLGYGPAHPILQRSRSLYRSVIGNSDGGFTVETPNYLAIGSDDPHIVFHQSRSPRSKIPRRPVASFTADQKNEIMRPIRLYLTGFDPATPQRTRTSDRVKPT